MEANKYPGNCTNDYIYEPLGCELLEIRILKIEPSESWLSDICCHLEHRLLGQPATSYEALSYIWDSGMENTPILVNGRRCVVTANLESFLRHRRHAHCVIEIWVDAVCINQRDVAEKSRQINLMYIIYGFATNIMVWLGKEDDDSDLAMDEPSRLGEGSPYNKMHIITGKTLTALHKLLSRTWWSRVWIIQEIFWGGAGIKLEKMRDRCGHKELTWMTLVKAAAKMQSHKDDQRQYFPALDNIFALESLRHQLGDMKDVPADERLVFDTVAQYRNFQATNPKDKIYALLGVTNIVGLSLALMWTTRCQ